MYGFVRLASAARRSPAEAGMAVAAGGMFLVWLVHTSVDWIHLIPGVTGAALAAAAVLLSPWGRAAPAVGRSVVHKLVAAACVVLVVAAALFLGRATLADRAAQDAAAHVTMDPRAALADTSKALSLNGDAISSYYLRSSAYARLGDYGGARGALLAALRVEPRNFVTWALLGDLAVRHGDRALAQRYYRHALLLNPRDPQLPALARSPPATP
jgi:tetratricopeptide (TPR) repeat protein